MLTPQDYRALLLILAILAAVAIIGCVGLSIEVYQLQGQVAHLTPTPAP